MIIQTQRPVSLIVLDTLLTLLAWACFLWLFSVGFRSLLEMIGNHNPEYYVNEIVPLINTFAFYTALGIINALILFSWARYNIYKYRGVDRRKQPENLSSAELINSFEISLPGLQHLHENQVVHIHHHPDGSVESVRVLQ